MNSYAIVKVNGRQLWIEENRFYDLNKLALQPDDTFVLNQILLVKYDNNLEIGKPFLKDKYIIDATVLRHFSGAKTRVYKMRPKKKTRKTFGSRENFKICKRFSWCTFTFISYSKSTGNESVSLFLRWT